jgi:hypothetical protein
MSLAAFSENLIPELRRPQISNGFENLPAGSSTIACWRLYNCLLAALHLPADGSMFMSERRLLGSLGLQP